MLYIHVFMKRIKIIIITIIEKYNNNITINITILEKYNNTISQNI